MKNARAVISLLGRCSYNDENKAAFKKASMALLRQVAKHLAMPRGTYTIRFNPGGIAVSGDATLHADNVYITMNADMLAGGPGILVRSCKGRRDYTGGRNQWYSWERLAREGSKGLASFAADIIRQEQWSRSRGNGSPNPTETSISLLAALGVGLGVLWILKILKDAGHLGSNGEGWKMPELPPPASEYAQRPSTASGGWKMPKLPPPAVTYRPDFYPKYESYQPGSYIWQLRPTAPVGLRPPHLTEEGSFGSKEAREIYRQRMDEARAEKAIRDYGRYASSPSALAARLAYQKSWLGQQKTREEQEKDQNKLIGAFLQLLRGPGPGASMHLERERKRKEEIEKAKTIILPEV